MLGSNPTPLKWDGNVWDYDKENEAPFLVTDDTAENMILGGQIKCKREADAEFIVRAVNNFEALLEALRTLTNAVEMEKLNPTNWHGLNGFIDMAKQVIKKLDSL